MCKNCENRGQIGVVHSDHKVDGQKRWKWTDLQGDSRPKLDVLEPNWWSIAWKLTAIDRIRRSLGLSLWSNNIQWAVPLVWYVTVHFRFLEPLFDLHMLWVFCFVSHKLWRYKSETATFKVDLRRKKPWSLFSPLLQDLVYCLFIEPVNRAWKHKNDKIDKSSNTLSDLSDPIHPGLFLS